MQLGIDDSDLHTREQLPMSHNVVKVKILWAGHYDLDIC